MRNEPDNSKRKTKKRKEGRKKSGKKERKSREEMGFLNTSIMEVTAYDLSQHTFIPSPKLAGMDGVSQWYCEWLYLRRFDETYKGKYGFKVMFSNSFLACATRTCTSGNDIPSFSVNGYNAIVPRTRLALSVFITPIS